MRDVRAMRDPEPLGVGLRNRREPDAAQQPVARGVIEHRPHPKVCAVAHREIKSWLMDMDGVLVHEEDAIPGAAEFIGRLVAGGTPFLALTNNSIYPRRDLALRLRQSGLDVPEDRIWTSALATSSFLEDQRPN